MIFNPFRSPERRMTTKSKKTKSPKSHNVALVYGVNDPKVVANGTNGASYKRPYRINPETAEGREKRLEKRKALTLRAFKLAYENHNGQKVS